MFKGFLRVRPISWPFNFKSLHHNRPKYSFSEQPNSNFDELKKHKITLPIFLAIGGATAAISAHILFSKSLSKKDERSLPDTATELEKKPMDRFQKRNYDIVRRDLEFTLETLNSASESAHPYGVDPCETYYEKIAKRGQDELAKDDPLLAKIYMSLGRSCAINRRPQKGIECFDKALKIIENGQKEAKKEDIENMFRQLMGEYKLADAYFKAAEIGSKVLEFVEVEKEPSLLEDIATLYSKAGDKKSIEYYQKFLNLSKKQGNSNKEIGRIIRDLASEYEKQGNDEHALALWKEFSGLFSGSENEDIAAMSLYGNLRSIGLYRRRNKLNEAANELDRLVERSVEILGDEHQYTEEFKVTQRLYREEKRWETVFLNTILNRLEIRFGWWKGFVFV